MMGTNIKSTLLAMLFVSPLFISMIALAQHEIGAENYKELSSIASRSCSGEKYFKYAVEAGPITAGGYGAVEAELQRMAEEQARLQTRAEILKTENTCA